MVTELGRQPWAIYGVLMTGTPSPRCGMVGPFLTFRCSMLPGVIVVWLLYRHIIRSPAVPEWRVLYAGGGKRDAGAWRELADLLAGVIFVALKPTWYLGGADFAAVCGTSSRSPP